MLNEKDKKEYPEETKMLINPRDEYMKNEGIKEKTEEIARKLLNKNMPLKEISEITELTTEEIKNL